MHEMQPVVTDDHGGVCLSCSSSQRQRVQCVQGHLVQLLPNDFGLLYIFSEII